MQIETSISQAGVPAPIGVDPAVIYPLQEVKRAFGLGEHALRQMRRRGLIIRRVGRRSFVSGASLCNFIEEQGKRVGA
jgi:hypothetical protein